MLTRRYFSSKYFSTPLVRFIDDLQKRDLIVLTHPTFPFKEQGLFFFNIWEPLFKLKIPHIIQVSKNFRFLCSFLPFQENVKKKRRGLWDVNYTNIKFHSFINLIFRYTILCFIFAQCPLRWI